MIPWETEIDRLRANEALRAKGNAGSNRSWGERDCETEMKHCLHADNNDIRVHCACTASSVPLTLLLSLTPCLNTIHLAEACGIASTTKEGGERLCERSKRGNKTTTNQPKIIKKYGPQYTFVLVAVIRNSLLQPCFPLPQKKGHATDARKASVK